MGSCAALWRRNGESLPGKNVVAPDVNGAEGNGFKPEYVFLHNGEELHADFRLAAEQAALFGSYAKAHIKNGQA